MDKLLQNVISSNETTQKVAINVVEQIAMRNDVKVSHLLRNLPKMKKNDNNPTQMPRPGINQA